MRPLAKDPASHFPHVVEIKEALNQAYRVEGRTSPNPPVGAVVVRDGIVLGEGATSPPGGPHAERVALAQAGAEAHGASLYTTLEPCTFHGRTPPCTEAIIAAGIRRVFYVARDPDPRMGTGCEPVLRAAGIEVERLDDRSGQVADLLAPFRCRVRAGRPLVTAKYAMTLDGRIASASGDSRWISSEGARQWVHGMRDRVDAVMVGAGTVLADNPALTTRLDQPRRTSRHPLRVIVDSHGRAPLDAQVLAGGLPGKTLVATVDAPPAWADALAARGVVVEYLPPDPQGRVALPELLALLARRGINHLMVEGGATLLGALADAQLIDQIRVFIAPKLILGASALGPFGGTGIARMADAIPFHLHRLESVDQNCVLTARVADKSWWNEEYT
ncbi:MAG: bifunctional diaminohydroxyphosphoribosylaminopyrimidine deaminase/5-amino-6-(5-phosphoribosylamino)uracil reductase RibD [Roseiflexaceae bacterium]